MLQSAYTYHSRTHAIWNNLSSMLRKTILSINLLLSYVLLIKLSVIFCFPNGPPVSVCLTAFPLHRKDGKPIPPQKTSAPFKIVVNTTSYRPGEAINIRVEGTESEVFKGLYLQVRPVKKSKQDKVRDVPIGSYRRILQNTKIIGCDVAMDTLVHKDAFVKMATEFDWIPPLLVKNDIVVRATILANYSTYWVNVESDVISLENVGPLPAEKLKEPWLKEIISTVQKQDDKKAAEEAVIARFEKGFTGALDPNGNVMVQYVLDLLPFEDKTLHGKPKLPPGFDVGDMSDDVDETLTMTDDQNSEEMSDIANTDEPLEITSTDKPSDITSMDAPSDTTSTDASSDATNTVEPKDYLKLEPLKSKADEYYDVLVKALLGGDKIVADALAKMID